MITIEEVAAYPIHEDERLEHIAHTFGSKFFHLQLEPLNCVLSAELAPAYKGGLSELYALSNGGSYLAPPSDENHDVVCENGFVGTLSAQAFGIASCMLAFSHLSFSGNEELAQMCAEHYHLLYGYATHHPEATAILQTIA